MCLATTVTALCSPLESKRAEVRPDTPALGRGGRSAQQHNTTTPFPRPIKIVGEIGATPPHSPDNYDWIRHRVLLRIAGAGPGVQQRLVTEEEVGSDI